MSCHSKSHLLSTANGRVRWFMTESTACPLAQLWIMQASIGLESYLKWIPTICTRTGQWCHCGKQSTDCSNPSWLQVLYGSNLSGDVTVLNLRNFSTMVMLCWCLLLLPCCHGDRKLWCHGDIMLCIDCLRFTATVAYFRLSITVLVYADSNAPSLKSWRM